MPKLGEAAVGFIVAALVILLTVQVAAATTDDQSPNWQIVNSNTSSQIGSWEEWIVHTVNTFTTVLPRLIPNFSVQMNSYVNGRCLLGDACDYTWWLQAVEVYDNKSGGVQGAYLQEGLEEVWDGVNGPLFCSTLTGSNKTASNLDISGASTSQTITLVNSTSDKYTFTALGPSGNVEFTLTRPCSYPLGIGPITSLTRNEGVIVGPATDNRVSFRPLNTALFTGTLWMATPENTTTSQKLGTQTGESSNLHQTEYAVGYSYGSSLYVISEWLNDNTGSDK